MKAVQSAANLFELHVFYRRIDEFIEVQDGRDHLLSFEAAKSRLAAKYQWLFVEFIQF